MEVVLVQMGMVLVQCLNGSGASTSTTGSCTAETAPGIFISMQTAVVVTHTPIHVSLNIDRCTWFETPE